jgi:hypothetical protein
MINNFPDDYNRFIGKYITVAYEFGSKYKRLHCKLLENYKDNLIEKLILLEEYKNLIYHINCDNIIYLMAEHEDLSESDTKPIFVNKNFQEEKSPFKRSQNKKDSDQKSASAISNDSTYNNQIQETNIICSENKISSDSSQLYTNSPIIISYNESMNYTMTDKDLDPEDSTDDTHMKDINFIHSTNRIESDSSQIPIDNPIIISDEEFINYTMTDEDLTSDNAASDHEDICDRGNVLEQYEKKANYTENFLSSPLAVFINWAFRGVYLTIYTTSGDSISGEVVFNYNHLIALKSDAITYYINPEQIEYFY